MLEQKNCEISICIGTYNRIDYLKRLLDSIAIQKYKNFEVIITDDSSNDSIEQYLKTIHVSFPIQYIRNKETLGTPKNWTAGIPYASGQWIKVMHDDDYFSDADSLNAFANAIDDEKEVIFSGYNAYFESTKHHLNKTIDERSFQKIKKNPFLLLAENKIGNPSVVLFKNNGNEWYNPAYKWLVDIEGYIKMLQNTSCGYIDKPLINMSYNDSQVTNTCFRNPSIEVYEWLFLYQQYKATSTKSILVYDAWWRMIRNLKIVTVAELQSYSRSLPIPVFLSKIIVFQCAIPRGVLSIGICSKLFMFFSYITNRHE
jgi:glycosyltransferase involved in cell wall biosynthesis